MDIDTRHHISNISVPALWEKKVQLGSNQITSMHKLRVQLACTLQNCQSHKRKTRVGKVMYIKGNKTDMPIQCII